MALDTKYRPKDYKDVLGQQSSTSVLKQFVKENKGFHQSYVFCGQHGSGKTTMGRILARALLCSSPVEGEPCNECESCKVFLNGGVHPNFEELDAATRSGKSDLAQIIEELNYSTFSGKRKIYLFDESHRLSKQALDALLKPMEDTIVGSEDKRLVCIFCTTEPEKMVSTIFSRCAPAFVIRANGPDVIAERLAYVCDQENISYDMDSLITIAEVSECHIRDSLKMVEGISMLGGINKQTVSQYLQIGANDYIVDLLVNIGSDLGKCVELAELLAQDVSPSSAYERLADCCMVAYRNHLGVGRIPKQWDEQKIQQVSTKGEQLLTLSMRFAAPPHKPSKQTLVLDVAMAHYGNQYDVKDPNVVINFSPQSAPKQAPSVSAPTVESVPVKKSDNNSKKVSTIDKEKGTSQALTSTGVWVDPRAIKTVGANKKTKSGLEPQEFKSILLYHLRRKVNGEGW